jgi:hypothetical protein
MPDDTTRPFTDPSVLTTEQLLREIQSVKDWTGALVDSAKEVTIERFRSVDTQFALSERQRVEQKKDTKDAVDAALSAAKEAVQEQTKASAEAIGKSEAINSNAQSQLATQFETGIKSVSEKFDDLKDRVLRLEQTKITEVAGHESQRMDYGLLVSIASVFISIIAIVVVVLIAGRP